MKKTILISLLLLGFVTSGIQAQRYSINKYKYDSRLYYPEFGDAYNPALCGVCSFLVPGLGQIVCGETGRGIAFMGGYIGCLVIAEAGAVQFTNSYAYGNSGFSGTGMMLLGGFGMLGVYIWSIADAVKVAKVNNMYIRDLRKTSAISLELAPYVTQISVNNQNTSPVGLSMRVKF